MATPGEGVTGGFSEEVARVPGLEFQDPGMQRGFWAEGTPRGRLGRWGCGWPEEMSLETVWRTVLMLMLTMAMAKDRVARLQLRRICPKPEFQDAPSLVGEVTGTRAARKVP